MCSCQRTVAGLSFRGLQPGAIDSDKFCLCKWFLAASVQFSVFKTTEACLRWHYGPAFLAGGEKMVGVRGVEPRTLRLSSACSNQLSYTPKLELLVELRRFELLTYSLQSYRSTN
jgi:hypothetical protein